MGVSQPTRVSKKNNSRHRQYKKWANKLQSKKEIIELESYKKAKILKKYAKLCADEGIESERVNIPGSKAKSASKSLCEEDENNTKNKGKKKKGGCHYDKLHKAQAVFKKNQKESDNEIINKDNEKKLPKQSKKRVYAETKKGQPIMKTQISKLLTSIQETNARENMF